MIHVDNAADESFQHSTCEPNKLKRLFNLHEDWVQELQDEAQVKSVHIVVQNCRTDPQCEFFLTDTALNCTKLH